MQPSLYNYFLASYFQLSLSRNVSEAVVTCQHAIMLISFGLLLGLMGKSRQIYYLDEG